MKLNSNQHVTYNGTVKRNPPKAGFYEKVILDTVDENTGSNYGVPQPHSPKEKAQFLYNRFMSEYGYRVKQVGMQTAMVDWLQGLAIDIPYTYHDIIELAKKGGSLPENATGKQEDKITENYWRFMAVQTLKLFRKYKVQ